MPSEIKTMTMPEYQASPGISKSQLDHLHRSPAHYRWYVDHPTEPTPTMILGTMLHKLALEPDTFDQEYAVLPEGLDRRTKEGKATFADWEAANIGKGGIKPETMLELQAMRDSLYSYDRVKNALQGGMIEPCLFWTPPGYDVAAKARPDHIKDGLVVDLKTTTDARLDPFSRQCWNLRYHVQAAYYMDAHDAVMNLKAEGFLYVVVENSPPYGVAIYLADEAMVDQARKEYRADLDVYCDCLAKDQWPGYPDIVQALTLPIWAQEDRDK